MKDCWASKWVFNNLSMDEIRPATETPSDRYDTMYDHAMSNIVQHSRTQWALEAIEVAQDAVDVVVWLDLGILKQGNFTGKPVTEDDVAVFMQQVANYDFSKDFPFPGITDAKDYKYDPFGNNWRFCGSTHIWPRKWLKAIDHSYRFHTREFIRTHKKIPLDLAVWPLVEQHSGLPFKWYKAEYDRTQLTEFPCPKSS